MGLRGTGSHDWLIEDAYVQDAHAFGADRTPCAAGPIWRVPDRAVVIWIANAGHALGVAQGAIDEVVAASRAVASTMDARPLSERGVVSGDVVEGAGAGRGGARVRARSGRRGVGISAGGPNR